jgi:hypothetical protein
VQRGSLKLLTKANDFDQKNERSEFALFILNHLRKQKPNGRSVLSDSAISAVKSAIAY